MVSKLAWGQAFRIRDVKSLTLVFYLMGICKRKEFIFNQLINNKYSKIKTDKASLKLSRYMHFSYNKLWKLLIDHGWEKQNLCQRSGVSSASIAKLEKNGNVTIEVLLKICKALGCDVSDIMEFVKELWGWQLSQKS